jgi:hypothetical protein
MPVKTLFEKAIESIRSFFKGPGTPWVMRKKDLMKVFTEHRSEWSLRQDMTFALFLKNVLQVGLIERVELISARYGKTEVRFTYGEPTSLDLALSLRSSGYLSHGSAVFLHGLNDQVPRTVFLNVEQSVKPAGKGKLTQEALNRAFSNQQRESQLLYEYRDTSVMVLSGKNTKRLEVGTLKDSRGVEMPVTKLERTLIDITVRPSYAGGVFQVLEAFKGAKDRAQVPVLLATLKQLDYIYPYHQALGFYLERAGYPSSAVERVHALGRDFDFYLLHGMKVKEYDAKWRLFYPKGL